MSTNYRVNQKRWAKLDIFNQMANIYSEVGRSFKTKNSNNSLEHNLAIIRAIDLFDVTIESLIKSKSPKAKEVLRSKEQFLAVVTDDTVSQESVQSLDRYFRQFAVAARLKR